MSHSSFQFSAPLFSSEHRLCQFQNPQSGGGIDALTQLDAHNTDAYGEKLDTWKRDTPGAEELLRNFASAEQFPITHESLQEYLRRLPQPPPNDIREQLRNAFRDLTVKDRQLNIDADRKITVVLEWLNKRSSVLRRVHDQVAQSPEKKVEFRDQPIEKVFGVAKDAFGAALEGYSQSSGKDKLIMLAGIAASFMLIRAVLHASAKKFPKLRFVPGTLVGLTISAMAFQAVNKAVEKSSGRPLFAWNRVGGKSPLTFPIFTEDPEAWKAEQHAKEIEKIQRTFEESTENLPQGLLNQILVGERRKHAGAFANVLNNMDADELRKLYQSTARRRSIPIDHPLYPRSPFQDDLLTPTERFLLIEDLSTTLGFVNLQDPQRVFRPLSRDEEKTSILYYALNFQT